ncbi:MAG: hypothetical protein OXH68_08455 [Gammaproteobacteria bacterium]|nr:hypothetical protein [Gammaproteobacteria bacterium]
MAIKPTLAACFIACLLALTSQAQDWAKRANEAWSAAADLGPVHFSGDERSTFLRLTRQASKCQDLYADFAGAQGQVDLLNQKIEYERGLADEGYSAEYIERTTAPLIEDRSQQQDRLDKTRRAWASEELSCASDIRQLERMVTDANNRSESKGIITQVGSRVDDGQQVFEFKVDDGNVITVSREDYFALVKANGGRVAPGQSASDIRRLIRGL